MLDGVDKLLSVADLNLDFPFPPEFASYVLDPTRGNGTPDQLFNSQVSALVFNADLDDANTFFNQEAMRVFYEGYANHDMSLMENHFMFNAGDWSQVELFHGYLDELVEHFLIQNSTYGYDIIAMSELMMKNMNSTVGYLDTELPLNLVARLMASNMKADSADCAYFWDNQYVGKTAE